MSDGPTAGKLNLAVVTHEARIVDVECDEVSLRGRLGYFGVLPGHIPMLSTLEVGELMYRVGTIEHYRVLSGGFCEVADDVVTVIAEFAETPEEIDVEAAQIDAGEATALLGSATGDDLKHALARVEAATVRIQVASRLG